MKTLTITERKRNQLERFNADYINDISKASYIINSFNRLCGLSDALLYRQNTESLCNSRYTKELEEKEERWIKRLNNVLKEYGLSLVWSGHIPQIGIKHPEDNRIEHVAVYWIASR